MMWDECKVRKLSVSIEISIEQEDPTLHLPRILCLHGGGTNATIFRAQCRVLSRRLKNHFRLCFADAPWLSEAGPDVTSVYKEWGPFRRWMRWLPGHPEIDEYSAVKKIEKCLEAAIAEDDRHGATGEIVGVLGFSQGAKMAASLLFRQQVRNEKLGPHCKNTNFRFAVLLAGRGPLVSLDPDLVMTPALVDASMIGFSHSAAFSNTYDDDDDDDDDLMDREDVLRLPTIHVHGMRDQGLALHRQLHERYCEPGSTRLVEWEGEHRVPVKSKDVTAVVREILDVAKETGVLQD